MIKIFKMISSLIGLFFISLLFMTMHFLTANSAIANYGESCSPLPVAFSDNYLLTSTAYGYLQGNLDMKTNVPNGCDQPQDQIQFCIRNQGVLPCDLVTMAVNEEKTISAISTNPDIGGNNFVGNIKVRTEVIGGDLCLVMPTSRGPNPLICREIEATDSVQTQDLGECTNVAQSCYGGGSKSQSLLNFSGLTIQCLTDTLDKVFFEGNNCRPLEEDISFTVLSPFSEFQEALKVAVRGALILYVMIYGFKIVMSPESIELNSIVKFIIKFLLVSYFAVGLGPVFYESGRYKQHNGMTEIALPSLVRLTSDFAQMVYKAGGSQGLCSFDLSRYENGYEYYGLWDSIDCRIGFYLGMQAMYNTSQIVRSLGSSTDNMGSSGNSEANFGDIGEQGVEALDDPFNLNFFTVMFGFLMSGNIIIVISGMVFAMMFMSIVLYFLTAYLVCTVTLYVLAYISPIFIPMALFERTKAYFDSWLRIVVSCTLQPAVIGGFIVLLLTIYDSAIYGNCEYTRHNYTLGENNFSTFEVRVPASEPEKCTASPGFKLIQYYIGQGWEEKSTYSFCSTDYS